MPEPSGAVLAGHRRDAHAAAEAPAESVEVHTRILRCMLAPDDCHAYWRHVEPSVPPAERARIAFRERWFGTKSEARVRTIMTDMIERFDAYPEALSLFQRLGRVPVAVRGLVCHLHTQLADRVYRTFSGDFLPQRRDEGRATVDRAAVARWVESCYPERWSAVTRVKFASNLLATALSAGLLRGRRDPRQIPPVAVPDLIVGYALYLLRATRIEGSLTENAYLRSLGLSTEALGRRVRVPGVRIAELGGVVDVTFEEPTLPSARPAGRSSWSSTR